MSVRYADGATNGYSMLPIEHAGAILRDHTLIRARRAAARRTIIRRARNRADARLLLSALGLWPRTSEDRP